MTNPLSSLEDDLGCLHAAWTGALPQITVSGHSNAGAAQGLMEQMSDTGLLAVTDALAQVRRDSEALLTRAAGEVARRSRAEFGVEGLAKSQGFHNPARLMAASTGTSTGQAARLVAVGVATHENLSFTGQRMPARHPHVGSALAAGAISVDAASAISSMLERVALRADPVMAEQVEQILTDLAARLPLDILQRAVKEAEARLDQDGREPADELRWQARTLSIREERSGLVRFTGRLDPVTAAPIRAAIDAVVTAALRAQRVAGPATVGPDTDVSATVGRATDESAGVDEDCDGRPIIDDTRTIPQMQADALSELIAHTLGCDRSASPLATTTVVVRMELDDLVGGNGANPAGLARIDGIDQPISAAAARLLAADAEIIPAVFGGPSVPLDLGRAARFFSREQRLAMIERDGGCAACGQNVTYAHAHHIRWWQRDTGPTDLDNGVMLCSFCHHNIRLSRTTAA